MSKTAAYNALGTIVYIFLISFVLSNGERLLGKMEGILAPVTFLSLFTLSATIVGGLIVGKPLLLYLDNKKKEAVSLFLQTVGMLAGFTILLIIVVALVKQGN